MYYSMALSANGINHHLLVTIPGNYGDMCFRTRLDVVHFIKLGRKERKTFVSIRFTFTACVRSVICDEIVFVPSPLSIQLKGVREITGGANSG
jgi:hypothetical protein